MQWCRTRPAGQQNVQVVVSHYGQDSPPFSVSVADTSPGIFKTGKNAILNYQFPNYSPNSAGNPAAPGSVIVVFATGAGVWGDTGQEGSIGGLLARPFTAKPVSLGIGGQPATIL